VKLPNAPALGGICDVQRRCEIIWPQRLDEAVCAAYAWKSDLSDEKILEKLLALNLERAKENK
jgi:hypothetical protein